jgi:hypothetical protein
MTGKSLGKWKTERLRNIWYNNNDMNIRRVYCEGFSSLRIVSSDESSDVVSSNYNGKLNVLTCSISVLYFCMLSYELKGVPSFQV